MKNLAMQELVDKVCFILKGKKLNLTNEKTTQAAIEELLRPVFGESLKRENENAVFFDTNNVPDFYIDGLCIEVKIKGNKMSIYRQCVRYCKFDSVKALLLITGVRMGFPEEINGKSCYIFNITTAWI